MDRFFKILLVFVLVCLSPASYASAEENSSSEGSIGADILGPRGRFYHVYLSVYGGYDDNIFNNSTDEQDDFLTVVAPTVQLALPATRTPVAAVDTSPTTPGGLVYGLFEKSDFRRLRASLSYTPWFQFYADNSDQNTINHYAQGMVQYNLPSGLSLNLTERFVKDYDRQESDISTQTDSFYTNLANLTANWDMTEKLRLRVGYRNFFLNYTDQKNDYRNRTDNAVSAYCFFKFTPKTAAFIQYSYLDIGYDNDVLRDGTEQHMLGGVQWNITAKTRGSLRAGYNLKQFENDAFDDNSGFIYQLNLDYTFTPKTSVSLAGYRRSEETNDQFYEYRIAYAARAGYKQKLTEKIKFELNFDYRNEAYQGGAADISSNADRTDNYYYVTPTLSYSFRRWLSTAVGYRFQKRTSTIDGIAYSGNLVYLKITGAI